MTANVGTLDRLFRLIAGLALIILPFTASFGVFDGAAAKYAATAVGAVLVITALAGRCPLYSLFGIRTCRTG